MRCPTAPGQRSLNAAARQLGIREAILTGQIRQLETAVGTALLRTGPDGRLTLTAYGQRFARDVSAAWDCSLTRRPGHRELFNYSETPQLMLFKFTRSLQKRTMPPDPPLDPARATTAAVEPATYQDQLLALMLTTIWAARTGRTLPPAPVRELSPEELLDFWADDQL